MVLYHLILEKIKAEIKEVNTKAGYKKYRSVSHFVESLVMDYTKEEKR
jgi:hypothetical protein